MAITTRPRSFWRLEGNPAYEGSSFVRAGRMKQLLDAAAGQIDLETCQELLRDHANYPGSICAHVDPPDYPSMTRAAVEFDSGTWSDAHHQRTTMRDRVS